MDPALRVFINYGIPLLSLGLLVATGFCVMAYLRRRQAVDQRAEVEEAILNKLMMPTLEELDGNMPGDDPFANGANNTEGMGVREKNEFLGGNLRLPLHRLGCIRDVLSFRSCYYAYATSALH